MSWLKYRSTERCSRFFEGILAKQESDTDTASENENESNDFPPVPYRLARIQKEGTYSAEEILQDATPSRQQAIKLAVATKDQRHSALWQTHRRGRITASNCHRAFSTNPVTSVKSFLHASKELSHLEAVKWGIEKENVAKACYVNSTSHHKDFGVRNTGLIVSLNNHFVAASPDGLVSCSCHPDRLVEIKCPYKYKETTPTDSMALNDLNYCLTKEGQLKKSHRYYCQVQTQLFVTQAPLCDFVVWTPHDMVILSIERDEQYLTNLNAKMQDFTINYLIPALISHKLENLNVLSAVDGNSLFLCLSKACFW